ncbi:MAG: MlaD family protein [Bilophila wadsworthia]
MSKSANKTLIGAFVVGATALLLLAIAVFGSGKLFQTTSRYVLFFDGSISGLSVGSPVLFRGVPVGRVVEIRLTGDLDNLVFQTPVFIELNKKDEGRFSVSDGDISKRISRSPGQPRPAGNAGDPEPAHRPAHDRDGFLPQKPDPLSHQGSQRIRRRARDSHHPSQFDNILQTLTTLPYDDIASNVLDITEGVKNPEQFWDGTADRPHRQAGGPASGYRDQPRQDADEHPRACRTVYKAGAGYGQAAVRGAGTGVACPEAASTT